MYTGQWHRGKQHGYGTMQFPDGSKYEGNWEENQMNANGKYLDPDGMLWEGIFVDNTFESKIQKKLQIEQVTKGTLDACDWSRLLRRCRAVKEV